MNGMLRLLTRGAPALLLAAGLLLAGAGPAAAARIVSRHAVVIKTLPHGYHTIRFGGAEYYVHEGRYYRRHTGGYALVPAPRGAVVVSLPAGKVRLTIGGAVYFRFADVYYRPVRGGFQVVAPPAAPARPLRIVTAARHLRVHSGPGTSYPAVSRLHRGTELAVTARRGEWYRVTLGRGGYGWINSRFTGPVSGR